MECRIEWISNLVQQNLITYKLETTELAGGHARLLMQTKYCKHVFELRENMIKQSSEFVMN